MAEVIAELVGKLSFEVDGKGLKTFNEGLEDTEKATKEAGVGTIALGNIIADLAGTVASATVDVVKFGASLAKDLVSDFVTSGREIDKWSKTIGVSVEELQRLEFAGQSVGAEADNVREAVKTLRENLGELDRVGSGPAVDALGTLGIKLEEIKDLGATEQLELFATALNELPDDSQRLSVALEVLGEDGRALLPLFQQGASGIQELTKRADEMGIVLDESAIKSAVDAGKSVDELALTAKGLANQILVDLVPMLTEVAVRAREWIGENRELIQQKVQAFIEGVIDAGEVMIDVGEGLANAFEDMGTHAATAAVAVGAFSLAIGGLPGLVIAAGGALAFAISDIAGFTDEIERATRSIDRLKKSNRRVAAGTAGIEEMGALLDDPQALANLTDADAERIVNDVIEGTSGDAKTAAQADSIISRFDAQRALARTAAAGDPTIISAENIALGGQQRAAQERAKRRAKFGKKAKSKGGAGAVDTSLAEELFTSQLEPLAQAAGLGAKALSAAFKASAESLSKGASEQVALQAGVGQLSQLSGLDLSGAGGPDAALFGLLTQIGGPQAARSATEGARFVRIDQSQTNHIEINVPERFGEAMTAPGMAEDLAAALRPILTGEYQQVIDRYAGGVEP